MWDASEDLCMFVFKEYTIEKCDVTYELITARLWYWVSVNKGNTERILSLKD